MVIDISGAHEKGDSAVRKDDQSWASEASLAEAADALLEAIRAEPVPPAIMALAHRLQATLDEQRRRGISDPASQQSGSV